MKTVPAGNTVNRQQKKKVGLLPALCAGLPASFSFINYIATVLPYYAEWFSTIFLQYLLFCRKGKPAASSISRQEARQ
jgi:hypothetical protein